MNHRAPLIAGVAFAVLYATAVLLIPALPTADSGLVRTQALLLAFSALAVVVVLAFARDRLAGPAAHLFTIGSSVTVAQLCVAVWFIAGPALRPGQVGGLDRPEAAGDSTLRITGTTRARALLYAGQPQGDPLVSYGPFIGDTREDIVRVMGEYRAGRYGPPPRR